MATSGYIDITVTSWDTLRFSWELESQNKTANTSTVSWKLELIAGSSGRISSTASKDYSITVNGETVTGTNKIGIGNNETLELVSGSNVISHNNDGTKTFNFSFSQEINITFSGEKLDTFSGSGSGTLPKISRNATIAATSSKLTLPEDALVQWYPVPGYYYKLVFSCGSWSKTDTGLYPNTSNLYTRYNAIPLDAAVGFSAGSDTGAVTVTLTTWSDKACTSQIGSASTATIPVSIPENSSTKPTVAVSGVSETGSGLGIFVAGKSKVVFKLTCAGKYGASTDGYLRTVTVNGVTYTTTADTLTTRVLGNSGNIKYSVTVKDSRGFTSSAVTGTIVVNAYAGPEVIQMACARCDSEGNEDSTGTYLKLYAMAGYHALQGKNNLTLTYTIGSGNETVATVTYDTGSNYREAYTDLILNADLSKTKSYRVTVKVTDSFGAHDSAARVIPPEVIFSHERKNSIGYGGYVDKENTMAVHWGIQPIKGFDLSPNTGYIESWDDLDVFIDEEMAGIEIDFVRQYRLTLCMDALFGVGILTISTSCDDDDFPCVIVTLDTDEGGTFRKTGESEGYGSDGTWEYSWSAWDKLILQSDLRKQTAVRNLLDNSDFTNPVNQRDTTEWSPGTTHTYCLDRWYTARTEMFLNSDSLHLAWDETNGSNGWIQQKVPTDKLFGETVTVAVTHKTGRIVASGTVSTTSGETNYIYRSENQEFIIGVTNFSNSYISVVLFSTVPAGSGINIQNVALYEGEFDENTVPPYVPKGYGAELAECLRYAVSLGGTFRYKPCQITSSIIDFAIPVPQPMRAYPSFDTSKLTLYGTSGTTQTAQTGFTFAVVYNGMNGFVIRATKSGHGLTDAMLSIASGTIFSADM